MRKGSIERVLMMNRIQHAFCALCVWGMMWNMGGIAQAASGGRAFEPVGKQELEKLAAPDGALAGLIARLEQTIPRKDVSAFTQFVQQDWLLDEITRPLKSPVYKASADIETAFRTGTRQSWQQNSLADEYLGQHFRFLRAQTVGGHTGLLFRAAGENGRLNFCLFTVGRGKDGRLAAYDIYVVGVGELVSDTLRRGYLQLVQSLHPSGESGRRASVYVEALPRVIEVNAARATRQHGKVLTLSSLLPEEIRHERTLMLIRLEAAENVSWDERSQAFAEWRRFHPNPMQLPFKWADYETASGRFKEAAEVLRQLNDALGGDSYVMARLGETQMLVRYQEKGAFIGGLPKSGAEVGSGLGGAR